MKKVKQLFTKMGASETGLLPVSKWGMAWNGYALSHVERHPILQICCQLFAGCITFSMFEDKINDPETCPDSFLRNQKSQITQQAWFLVHHWITVYSEPWSQKDEVERVGLEFEEL